MSILLDPCLTGALDEDEERVVTPSTYLLRGAKDRVGLDHLLAGCLLGWDSELADPAFLRATDRRFMGQAGVPASMVVLH